MTALKVLVSSPDRALGEFLESQLASSVFKVVTTQSGPGFLETVHRERPEIAVIDQVHDSPDTAVMEIVVLKEIRPDIRIIALSRTSSPQDAKIVELGVFYYTGLPAGSELIQVIKAAAQGMDRSYKRSLQRRIGNWERLQ